MRNIIDIIVIAAGLALIAYGYAYKGKSDGVVHFRTSCGPTVYQSFWATNPVVYRFRLTNTLQVRTYSGIFYIRTGEEKLATNVENYGARNETRD